MTIGAYRLNHKPFDFMFLPDADHIPARPREIMALTEASNDWLSFWLQNYEDPDPAKAEQYARWRRIRGDWQAQTNAVQAGAAPAH